MAGVRQTLSKLAYRMIDATRSSAAFEAARRPATAVDLSGFTRARQCLLVTFKRSGQPVPSPVNFGLADGKLYLRTDGTTAKVKRLRHDPHAVVVPCNLRGTPTGTAVDATARILPDNETTTAEAIIAANWTPGMRILERGLDHAACPFDIPIVHIEVTPGAP